MANRESQPSRPSAATHHLTQASTTLNRRYVKQPKVIAVNQSSDSRTTPAQSAQPSTPSRLVNLKVHASEIKPAEVKSTEPVEIKSTESAEAKSTESIKVKSPEPKPAEAKLAETKPATAKASAKTTPVATPTQLDTLKSFAAEIKTHSTDPALKELGDTIDRFVAVATKSAHQRDEQQIAAATPISPQISRAATKVTVSISEQTTPTTLKQPVSTTPKQPVSTTPNQPISTTPKQPAALTPKPSTAPASKQPATTTPVKPEPIAATPKTTPDLPAQVHPLQRSANRQIRARKQQPAKPSSREIKDRAIKQALRSVATMSEAPAQPIKHRKSGAKRFVLAFTCAAACLAAIVWFVSNNIPDVSVRVAAMQTGIEATYPSYVPMDYSLSDIISEDGKLTMIFSGPDDARFTLVQEKSSWDSATLLRNYVEPTWGEEYVTTHEQGITIYISNQTNDSTWVNGGIRYSITSEGARLTKKQTRNIVLSL